MGLSISHDAWDGSYGGFHRWRQEIAKAAGYPPLDLMEGYYRDDNYNMMDGLLNSADIFYKDYRSYVFSHLPIKWEILRQSPLINLLTHSDCDGSIRPKMAGRIADRLEALLPLINPDWQDKTKKLIDGFRLASSLNERIIFS